MKRANFILNREYLVLPIGLVFSILLILLDTLGFLSFLRTGISFVFEPISYNGKVVGSEVKNYFENFVKLSEFRDEYNRLKIDIYEKDVNNAYYSLLREENESLRKQISLGDLSRKYVTAKTMKSDSPDYLNLNVGDAEDVIVNDIVSWGNMYVGTVIKSDLNGSLVQLASSKGSNLEVIVTEVGVKDAIISTTPVVLSKGVVSGTADGIRIENISMSANVKDGDIVVINDSKVGEYLVLGYLVGLSDNPATTSRSGYVSPLMDYDSLITVFVRVD